MSYRMRLIWARRRLGEWEKKGERELVGDEINGFE